MSQQPKSLHLLPMLHLLLMIGVAVWWGAFFWSHTPSRTIFHAARAAHGRPATREITSPFSQIGALSDGPVARLALATRAAVADLGCGLGTLVLLGIGSGMYVRRFDTWLHARTSGQAVAFRGQDLTAATLDANAKHQRGVLR